MYHEVPLYVAMEKPCSGIVGPVSTIQISYEKIYTISTISSDLPDDNPARRGQICGVTI